MTFPIYRGEGEPEEPGLYAAMVRGGWKILEWSETTRTWHYPGLDADWQPDAVSKWVGPLDDEEPLPGELREYDL